MGYDLSKGLGKGYKQKLSQAYRYITACKWSSPTNPSYTDKLKLLNLKTKYKNKKQLSFYKYFYKDKVKC